MKLHAASARTPRSTRRIDLAGFLELQHRAQPFVHRPLQARWQRPNMFGQKAAIESQQLRDVHNRIAGQARRARWQQDIARGGGDVHVCVIAATIVV